MKNGPREIERILNSIITQKMRGWCVEWVERYYDERQFFEWRCWRGPESKFTERRITVTMEPDEVVQSGDLPVVRFWMLNVEVDL